MQTADFDYHLPAEFIAQTPMEPRDHSRLLVLERNTGRVSHSIFQEIGQFLQPGDLLVLNETRVIPARLWFLYASLSLPSSRLRIVTIQALAGQDEVFTERSTR